MYQTNAPKITAESIKNFQPKLELSIFEQHHISALTFIPTDMFEGVCYLARDILNNRNDIEINIISKAIKEMLSQGTNLGFALLASKDNQKSLYFSEGRALYLLHDKFDLSSLNISHLSWAEIFSVLALMQCAEVSIVAGEKDVAQAVKDGLALKLESEIADSISRAEVLIDTQTHHEKSGAKGGNAKAQKILPLKSKVINKYYYHYSEYDNKRAGAIIEAELVTQDCELLTLSKTVDKATQFATWIADFKKGKLKNIISIAL